MMAVILARTVITLALAFLACAVAAVRLFHGDTLGALFGAFVVCKVGQMVAPTAEDNELLTEFLERRQEVRNNT